jgi:predicted ATPase
MLVRLKINGFKNLSNAEIAFGPFTCIAGTNGVGKSNLFDAIMFLRDLTDFSLTEAAARVRDPVGRSGDLKAIFHRNNAGQIQEISFESDFVVAQEVLDDFGRKTNYLEGGFIVFFCNPMNSTKAMKPAYHEQSHPIKRQP